MPPYVVFMAFDGLAGGNGGPWAYVSYTVVDSSNTCLPGVPAEWMVPLLVGDAKTDVQGRTQTGMTDYLVANFGISPTDISYTWLT